MKRLSLLAAMLFAVILVNAQTETKPATDEVNTIFGEGGKAKLGWFIGIDPGYTKFNNKEVWLGGLSVGMVINHNFTIGLTGRTFTNEDDLYYPTLIDTVGLYLKGGYGGLLLEYTLFPKSPVHITFPVMIGGGSLTYTTDKEYEEWDDDETEYCHKRIDRDDFFTIEPGVRAEVNILKFMRLNGGISYRYAAGLNMVNTPADLMDNFTATIGLKFGKF